MPCVHSIAGTDTDDGCDDGDGDAGGGGMHMGCVAFDKHEYASCVCVWLAGCPAGWLAGWVAGWLPGWPAGWRAAWLAWLPPPQIRSCWTMVLDNWFIRKYYILNTF